MQTKTGSLYINPRTLVFLLSSLVIFWMMLYLPLPFYHHAFSLAMGERPPHPSPCAKIVVKHGGYYYRSFKSSSSLYILFKGGMFEFPVLTDPQEPEEVYRYIRRSVNPGHFRFAWMATHDLIFRIVLSSREVQHMLKLALHKKKLTSRPYIEKIVLHRRRRRMLPSRDFYSSLLLHRRRATIMYIQRHCRSPAGAWWLGINSGRTLQREVIQKTKKIPRI